MSQVVNSHGMGTPESSYVCNMRTVRVVQIVIGVVVVIGFAAAILFPSSRATLRRERGKAERTPFLERKANAAIRTIGIGVASIGIAAIVFLHRHSGTRVDIYPQTLVIIKNDQTTRLAWSEIRHLTQEPDDSSANSYGFVNLKELPELIAGLGQKPMYVETRDGQRHVLSPALERRDELISQIQRHLKSRPDIASRA